MSATSYFVGPKYGSGWEWEDLTWYYGAEISPLTINDNALDLFIKPGTAVGQPALITTGPPDPLLTIDNRVTTAAKGTRRQFNIHRGLGENTVTIAGSIRLKILDTLAPSAFPSGAAVRVPAAHSLAKGVVITGKSRKPSLLNHRLHQFRHDAIL